MSLYTTNGALLLHDGKLATSEDCCDACSPVCGCYIAHNPCIGSVFPCQLQVHLPSNVDTDTYIVNFRSCNYSGGVYVISWFYLTDEYCDEWGFGCKYVKVLLRYDVSESIYDLQIIGVHLFENSINDCYLIEAVYAFRKELDGPIDCANNLALNAPLWVEGYALTEEEWAEYNFCGLVVGDTATVIAL